MIHTLILVQILACYEYIKKILADGVLGRLELRILCFLLI